MDHLFAAMDALEGIGCLAEAPIMVQIGDAVEVLDAYVSGEAVRRAIRRMGVG